MAKSVKNKLWSQGLRLFDYLGRYFTLKAIVGALIAGTSAAALGIADGLKLTHIIFLSLFSSAIILHIVYLFFKRNKNNEVNMSGFGPYVLIVLGLIFLSVGTVLFFLSQRQVLSDSKAAEAYKSQVIINKYQEFLPKLQGWKEKYKKAKEAYLKDCLRFYNGEIDSIQLVNIESPMDLAEEIRSNTKDMIGENVVFNHFNSNDLPSEPSPEEAAIKKERDKLSYRKKGINLMMMRNRLTS